MPRKTKLNPKLQEEICKGLKLGMTYKAAAESQGITEQTFWRWMREGEKARSGRKREFYSSIQAAVATSQKVLLTHVHKGAEKNPALALELLGRRWPNDFGRRATIENRHTGPDGKGPVRLVTAMADLNDEELRKYAYGEDGAEEVDDADAG